MTFIATESYSLLSLVSIKIEVVTVTRFIFRFYEVSYQLKKPF